MPKLSKHGLRELDINIQKFKMATGLDTFSFEKFEKLAEKLEKKTPGRGYQRAYQETLTELFKTAVLRQMYDEQEMSSVSTLVAAYDKYLMGWYIVERENEGKPVKIHVSEDIPLETLESFQAVLRNTPDVSVYDYIERGVKKGEYAHDNLGDWAQRLKQSRTKIPMSTARRLASCAVALEKKNKARNPIWRFFVRSIHNKELRVIEELKALAVRDLTVEDFIDDARDLSEEAKKQTIFDELMKDARSDYPNPTISQAQLEIDFSIRSMKDAQHILNKDAEARIKYDEKEMDLEKLQALDEEEFSKFFTEDRIDKNKINEFLDESMNLEESVLGDSIEAEGDENESELDLNESTIEAGSFLADEDDARFSIEVNELLYEPIAIDGELSATDNFNKLASSRSFIEKTKDDIVALIGKPDVDYKDKESWAEFSVCEAMLNEAEHICRLYDEAKANEAGLEDLEKIMENGANALYDLAYLSIDGFDAYARGDNGFALEERPVIAQKLTDLFLNSVTPVKFNANEFGKFKENYVIKNRDHAIQVMHRYDTDVTLDKCTEIVDNAVTELHAFEKVEFDKGIFDSEPKEIELNKAQISVPTKDKDFAK